MSLTMEYRSSALGRPRRPSTTRSMLKAVIRKLGVADDVRAALRRRLELMGRGSGDTERFFLDEVPGILLEDFPDIRQAFMEEVNRIRMRNGSPPYTPVA